ncbi:antirepressor AbbA [Alkalihalobacillus sp. TS-13]|uniref:antirepressor AbbA n=1 Tax=Alkalihalobacillus sp. TS-13 TaxID=2842455 RepID=UPI0021AA5EB9|nr:antirepressor AbbA [Alkalihalobacillus sp. TS-13]
MATLTMLRLSEEEKALLLDVMMEQRYASELISCEITDIETGQKQCEDARVKRLNNLLVRLHKAGV